VAGSARVRAATYAVNDVGDAVVTLVRTGGTARRHVRVTQDGSATVEGGDYAGSTARHVGGRQHVGDGQIPIRPDTVSEDDKSRSGQALPPSLTPSPGGAIRRAVDPLPSHHGRRRLIAVQRQLHRQLPGGERDGKSRVVVATPIDRRHAIGMDYCPRLDHVRR
jgi:hypothetical protein